jgi:hypothetical protein
MSQPLFGRTAGSAALTVAQREHKVLLIEEGNCLGGVSSDFVRRFGRTENSWKKRSRSGPIMADLFVNLQLVACCGIAT